MTFQFLQQPHQRIDKPVSDRDQQVIKLVNEGYKNYEIADRLGIGLSAVGMIIHYARKRGEFIISRDRTRRRVASMYLVSEAAKRRVSEPVLISRLLEVIERDKMVAAILDDAEEP